MVGFIDVGGSLRGIYTSGVYDYLMDKNIKPEYAIGVSSGSANLTAYVANERGRTARFYSEYLYENKAFGLPWGQVQRFRQILKMHIFAVTV